MGDNAFYAHSNSSSVSNLATSLAQQVGLLSSPSSARLPSEAELHAMAEAERARSRAEAERILSMEANGRDYRHPPRSQTMPDPVAFDKEDKPGWWTAAKNRLTPTKELTPAQQVIQDAKSREKEQIKKGKGKDKEKDWSGAQQQDPNTMLHLNYAPRTPERQPSSQLPAFTPSPMQAGASPSSQRSGGDGRGLLYAAYTQGGSLDVAQTLTTIAARFEKLERWTVNHVRALEARMSDVERYLVEKEEEREHKDGDLTGDRYSVQGDNAEALRADVAELQARMGILGREIARILASPDRLASSPARSPVVTEDDPHTRATSVHAPPGSSIYETSPPSTRSPAGTRNSGRTKLPYPTGDYASPHGSSPVSGLPSSSAVTTTIPPAMTSLSSRSQESLRSGSPVAGLPGAGVVADDGTSLLKSPNSGSPSRFSSTSPTPGPRKRYTVALGAPLRSTPSPSTSPSPSPLRTGSPLAMKSEDEAEESDSGKGGETIGKKSGLNITMPYKQPAARESTASVDSASSALSPKPSDNFSGRPASLYGRSNTSTTSLSSMAPPQNPSFMASLGKPAGTGHRARARSTADFFSESKSSSPSTRAKDAAAIASKRKSGVVDLVAFFDKDRKTPT